MINVGRRIDRAGALRAAVRQVVARTGVHGASMGSIASAAGVATGTAYVHYSSKDELVVAAYLEAKSDLTQAIAGAVDAAACPRRRFEQIWTATYTWLTADRSRAAFLVQFDASPLAAEGHARAMALHDDPLVVEATQSDLAPLLVALPLPVLYDMALGPVVRAVAAGIELDTDSRAVMIDASWRAISVAS